jgi:ubiquinone/menaquinone biosynthesis C-methylase UbiE
MKPETVSLLCAPGSHEPLRLASESGPSGSLQDVLVGVNSGQQFPIRDGIPFLLDQSKVVGPNQRYQRAYDRAAGLYDGGIRLFGIFAGGGEGHFRKEYLAELEVSDGTRLLEVSIGTGANLHYLPPTLDFYGVDISSGMLKRCQRNLKRWQLEAELILGNAEDLPLRDETFDAVLHVGGINAFSDRARAIAEMIRVARAGTKVVIVDETAKLMKPFQWLPGFRGWMEQFGDRFSPPVGLVPAGMKDVHTTEIAKGGLYCLSFRKP